MKSTTKKNTLAASFLAVTALLACALAPSMARAQQPDAGATRGRLAGVWESNVTITNCETGAVLASFGGLGKFDRLGGLEQVNNMPASLGKIGLGSWQYTGGQHYVATFEFFRYDANGAYSGIQKVTRDIVLAPGSNTFNSTIAFVSYDVNGNAIASGCGTETATRVVD
jgi:hypothetical protein